MVYSPPDSSVHGISQARLLEWAAIYNSIQKTKTKTNPKQTNKKTPQIFLSYILICSLEKVIATHPYLKSHLTVLELCNICLVGFKNMDGAT